MDINKPPVDTFVYVPACGFFCIGMNHFDVWLYLCLFASRPLGVRSSSEAAFINRASNSGEIFNGALSI